MTLLLSNEDAARLLDMCDCIDVLEGVYRELAEGLCVSRRTSECMTPTSRPGAAYALKSMDGVIPSLGVGAIRINSDILTAPNQGSGMRRVKVPAAPNQRYVGLVLLFSTETGEPLAIFPDGVVQQYRVGATSALALKYLARADAGHMAILGTGWQARTQLLGACAVRHPRSIRCVSPNAEHRAAFASEMTERLGLDVTAVDRPEAAVAGADIVLCASNSLEPIFFAPWVTPGMHLSSIKTPEIETAALQRADVLVVHSADPGSMMVTTRHLQTPETAAGKGIAAAPPIDFRTQPTLPDLVSGRTPGRQRPEQVTCFLNQMGLGLQFAAIGAVVYRKAREAGLGRDLPTDWFTEDVHP
jgi:alanine dehydrogenase